jgi:phage-related protein
VGSSHDDLRKFPEDVKDVIGVGLLHAQKGGKHPNAKPLRGFGGTGILEMCDDYDGDTYRAVYTVKLKKGIYVLHAFQKKSKRGIETPKSDMDLIRVRLRMAEEEDKRA